MAVPREALGCIKQTKMIIIEFLLMIFYSVTITNVAYLYLPAAVLQFNPRQCF